MYVRNGNIAITMLSIYGMSKVKGQNKYVFNKLGHCDFSSLILLCFLTELTENDYKNVRPVLAQHVNLSSFF